MSLESEQKDRAKKQQNINKFLFLLQTKWIDVIKSLSEISQLQLELFKDLMGDKE